MAGSSAGVWNRRRNRDDKNTVTNNPQTERTNKRLKWRCRRGTKELDLILSTFVDYHYHGLNETERRLFDQLLESADPQLADWLCHGHQPADQGMAVIVERILSTHRA